MGKKEKENLFKIVDWYIIKKYLSTFFLAISLLLLIIIVFDISEKIDDFIDNKAPLFDIIFVYYLNFVPYFVNLFSPLFAFIAVVFFTSRMAFNSEIIAMMSNGISFRRMLRPYMVSAVMLAFMSLILANFIIPRVNVNRMGFEKQYVNSPKFNIGFNIHMQISPGTYAYAESFDIHSNSGYRFSLIKTTSEGLVFKLDAQRFSYDTATSDWVFDDYFIRHINGKRETIRTGRQLKTKINMVPEDFNTMAADVEVMNYNELRQFIRKEKLKGTDLVKFYQVEEQTRMAYPFATIILTLIGAVTSSRKLRGGIGIHLGIGLMISFSFILIMKISTVFATSGDLSPVIAVWLPDIIFAVLAVILVRKAQS